MTYKIFPNPRKNDVYYNKMKTTYAILVAVLCTACRSGTAPYENVSVTVDSTVYHLRPERTWYTIRLTATIANKSGHDIYLSRFCPSTSLARPKGYSPSLELGQYACATAGAFTPLPTLTLSPGSSHTESLTLEGDEQPRANPQITMENLTGPAVFGFLVSTDLRRFEPVQSAPFVLQSPQ